MHSIYIQHMFSELFTIVSFMFLDVCCAPPYVTRCAFMAWAVGTSRNRDNWQLTTLKQSRNVLRLIAVFAAGRRGAIHTLDPYGAKEVFKKHLPHVMHRKLNRLREMVRCDREEPESDGEWDSD